MDNRDIKAVGLDSLSLDYGKSVQFKSHQVLFDQDISGFENVENLDTLPPKNAFVIALPMKIKNGSGLRSGWLLILLIDSCYCEIIKPCISLMGLYLDEERVFGSCVTNFGAFEPN